MRCPSVLIILIICSTAYAQFDGPGGEVGSRSIHKDYFGITNWATDCVLNLGWQNLEDTSLGKPTIGTALSALGAMDGDVVSLGDGGSAVLTFENPIVNIPGFDFAVFENGFKVGLSFYLELAFVEVSADGKNYVRFPNESVIDTSYQTDNFAYTNPIQVYNLAGKHQAPYGTLFDLNEVGLDSIKYVKIIDVVGSITDSLGSRDSKGKIINDPYPSPFESSGFDLDAVAVVNGVALSIADNQVSKHKILPTVNQAGSKFNLVGKANRIIVRDILGKEVLCTQDNYFRIFNTGNFIVSIHSKDKIYQTRICVQ